MKVLITGDGVEHVVVDDVAQERPSKVEGAYLTLNIEDPVQVRSRGKFRESRPNHLHKPKSHHKNDLELELVAMLLGEKCWMMRRLLWKKGPK